MFSGTVDILQKSVTISQILTTLLVLVVGIFLAIILSRLVSKFLTKKLSVQISRVVQRLIFYVIIGIMIFIVLGTLGINLPALLAAAGVIGLAIAFASQSSIANIISGLFLLGERPFQIGDAIRVGKTVGVVMDIGLISTKLRTSDNLSVRIPNEDLLKKEITTFTRYQIRRRDINVSIAYKEHLPRVKELLRKIVQEHPLVLVEPAPLVLNNKLGDSGIDIVLRVWFYKTNSTALLNDLTEKVKTSLDEAKIEIPFPHVKLYFDEQAMEKMKPPL